MKTTLSILFLFLALYMHSQETTIGTRDGIEATKEDAGAGSTNDASSGNPPEAYTIVEEMPEFPGGSFEMHMFVKQNLRYPASAREANIQGKSFVKFIVFTDGTLHNIEVIKGVAGCKACDEEAVRLVKTMPAWSPGKMAGKPVNVWYNMPVNFKLN